jgi:putative transposase
MQRSRISILVVLFRNGCIERFFRTLKEQLLWVRAFRNVSELREALTEFRDRYNHH